MINKNLKKRQDEELDYYYKRVLEERYNTIKDRLLTELHQLKDK